MRIERQNLTLFLRWLAYAGLLLLCAALQTAPGFLRFGGVAPILIVPACLAFALYEGEFAGALMGALGGLLWDAAAGRVGGYFAIMLLIACFLAGCLWQLYLKDNAVNFLWITTLSCWAMLSIDFIFSYWLRGWPGPGQYYLYTLLPTCLLTAVCGLALRVVYRLARKIQLKPKKR